MDGSVQSAPGTPQTVMSVSSRASNTSVNVTINVAKSKRSKYQSSCSPSPARQRGLVKPQSQP
eukprot:12518802-Prorocentrum_lima.AAC.1